MRKKVIMMIAVLALSITACGPMYEYRDLDGMWQLRHIEYENGDTKQLDNLYFSFQKHVINVRRLNQSEHFGTFKYTDDSLHVCFRGTVKENMLIYGMNDTIQHFRVEESGGDRLVLKSDYARLEFRDY